MRIPPFIRPLAVAGAVWTLMTSLFLYGFTSRFVSHALPMPACALQLPFAFFQTCALDDGIHVLAEATPTGSFVSVRFERATYMGTYNDGFVVNILGLVIAVLPTELDEHCFTVGPYAALVLPYWLLIVGSGCLVGVLTPIAGWIAPYFRWSKGPAWLSGLVFLALVLLNVWPSRSPAEVTIHAETVYEWVALLITPRTIPSDILLDYGFPFSYYREGFIKGVSSTNYYHGMEVGWKPHKAMEDFCLAALTAFAVGVAAQCWQNRRGLRQPPVAPGL